MSLSLHSLLPHNTSPSQLDERSANVEDADQARTARAAGGTAATARRRMQWSMRDGRLDLHVPAVDAAGALDHLRKVRVLSPVRTDREIGVSYGCRNVEKMLQCFPASGNTLLKILFAI